MYYLPIDHYYIVHIQHIYTKNHIHRTTEREKGHCIATDGHNRTTIGTEDINKIYIEVMTKHNVHINGSLETSTEIIERKQSEVSST